MFLCRYALFRTIFDITGTIITVTIIIIIIIIIITIIIIIIIITALPLRKKDCCEQQELPISQLHHQY